MKPLAGIRSCFGKLQAGHQVFIGFFMQQFHAVSVFCSNLCQQMVCAVTVRIHDESGLGDILCGDADGRIAVDSTVFAQAGTAVVDVEADVV